MDIEPFLIASSVRVFLVQRLVCRLCPQCAEADGERHDHYLRSIGFPVEEKHHIKTPVGCRECRGAGCRRRIAVGEQTGNLAKSLQNAANRYGKELDTRIKRLTALISPAIINFLAIVVAVIAYCIVASTFSAVSGIRAETG